ncbi:MAG: hypothetical protein ACLFVQ_06980 [Chitinispirillaceae bacterium]
MIIDVSVARSRYGEICAVSALTLLGFTFHYLSLTRTPFANGWDSYFYLLQIKSWFENGHLVSSRISVFYPVLIAFKWLTGNYILGVKVMTAFSAALVIPLSFWLVSSITKQKIPGLVTALLTLCSPHLFYFASQYPKNLVGYVFLLSMLIFLVKQKYLPAILFVILSLLAHKLTGAMALAALFLFIGHQIIFRHKKHKLLLWGLIPVGALLCIPKIFALHDFERQLGIFTAVPQSFAFMFFREFEGLLTLLWKIEIVAATLATAALAIMLLTRKATSYRLWVIPVLFLLLNFPFLRWDMNGFSFRFFLLAVLFGSSVCGIAVSLFPRLQKGALICTLLLAPAVLFTYKSYDPGLHDPPYAKYSLITDRLASSEVFSQAQLFIAHKGLAEYIKFTTDKDAMSWIPEYEMPPNTLWRVVAGVRPFRLRSFILPDTVYELGFDYSVVPETNWQLFLKDVQDNHSDFHDDYTTWMNPSRVRPVFLQKFRRKDD